MNLNIFPYFTISPPTNRGIIYKFLGFATKLAGSFFNGSVPNMKSKPAKQLFHAAIIIIFFAHASVAQNKDWQELQDKIDSAVKVNGTVYINRNYTIDKPLIVHNWNGKEYRQVSIRIIGNATYTDNERVSRIQATFKDAPILSIQKGVGCIVRGINFTGAYRVPNLTIKQYYQSDFDTYGDTTCRDTRWSPYSGIALDPFTAYLPPDSGYPNLREWYRGPQTRGGNTGTRIEDCTFSNVTVGIIVSPNGYTQNGELLQFTNIRFKNCKAGFVGCQGQERMNKITGVMAWENVHTVFVFNKYGAKQPGHYLIDGVNIAGSVVDIIHRYSGGWGPVHITNLYAESIRSIGIWDGTSGDVLSNALIHFREPEESGVIPDFHLRSNGLKIINSTLRYLDRFQLPLLLSYVDYSTPPNFSPYITDRYGWEKHNGFKVDQLFSEIVSRSGNSIVVVNRFNKGRGKVGSPVVFMDFSSWEYRGQGLITAIQSDSLYTVSYISPSIKEPSKYRIGVYERN